MTNQHPITPSLELVHQWADMLSSRSDHAVFSLATQWGADQELEACVDFVQYEADWNTAEKLRAARCPKTPSLKKQALKALEPIERYASAPVTTNKESLALIRKALEALPND